MRRSGVLNRGSEMKTAETVALEKAIRRYIVSETIIFAFQLAPFILMAIAVILGIVLATNILIGYCKKLKDRA